MEVDTLAWLGPSALLISGRIMLDREEEVRICLVDCVISKSAERPPTRLHCMNVIQRRGCMDNAACIQDTSVQACNLVSRLLNAENSCCAG